MLTHDGHNRVIVGVSTGASPALVVLDPLLSTPQLRTLDAASLRASRVPAFEIMFLEPEPTSV